MKYLLSFTLFTFFISFALSANAQHCPYDGTYIVRVKPVKAGKDKVLKKMKAEILLLHDKKMPLVLLNRKQADKNFPAHYNTADGSVFAQNTYIVSYPYHQEKLMEKPVKVRIYDPKGRYEEQTVEVHSECICTGNRALWDGDLKPVVVEMKRK